MTLVERFLKYVSFDTQSSEETEITPSTPGQMVFARYLKEELESLGLEEITLDENGYLFATLPANTDKPLPVIGFIAHMDTSPDMSGKNVSPRIVQNYDGKDIVLCAEENVVLSPAQFPELLDHQGEDLIVTDGKTLLGADDKAGIAEIVSAVVYLKEHPEMKYSEIKETFPDSMLGKELKLIGLIVTRQEIIENAIERYKQRAYGFYKEDRKFYSSDGFEFYVSNWWNITNIDSIIQFAKEQGWTVEPTK